MINAIKRKFKKSFTKDFCNNINGFEVDYNIKKSPQGFFQSFGDKNPDKIFYVIWIDKLGSGLFANFANVLCHLKIADEPGMTPVIDFNTFKTQYNERSIINSTQNAWEYYFKPVSFHSLEEVYESKNVFFCNGLYPQNMSYCITAIPDLYETVYLKYIKIQDYITDATNKYKALLADKRTLGVHFRGKEMNIAPGHNFAPTEKQMIKYTDEIIKKYDIEQIFLVTEEPKYLDLFLNHYGEKVIYTDSYRCHKVNAYNIKPRENHRYLLGLEVLIDALLLSKCNGLLCGDSNVTEFARFENNNNYEFLYDIRNGVNAKRLFVARYLYNIKKLLPKNFGGLLDIVQINERNKD